MATLLSGMFRLCRRPANEVSEGIGKDGGEPSGVMSFLSTL